MTSRRSLFLFAVGAVFGCLRCEAQILTAQYDNARTRDTLHETTLTPANVNVGRFGKIFSFPVDGDVYAQPQFLPNVEIPGNGTPSVLSIRTHRTCVDGCE